MASKLALIIANTEYSDPGLAQLSAPGRDAKEFARVLVSAELGAFDDVIILFNENSYKVSEVIDRFFSAKKPDDLLLLYFSGHGVRDEYGSLYLAVKNTNRERLRSTAIKSDFIREAMDQSRSRRQVLILDCCNSGAFAQGTKAETGGSVGTAKAFEGIGYGRTVLAASDSTQFAWEGDKVIGSGTTNSLFTHFLVKGLEGEADRDGDGKITIDELYDYAYEQVVSQTSKQTPGKWTYRQQGDIVLRENLKPRDVKPSPLPHDLLEMLSHPNSGVRRAGIQELTILLDGKHLGLARAAQDKLREIMENDDSLTLRKTANDTLIAHETASEQPLETPKESLSVAKPAPFEVPKEEHKEEIKIQEVSTPPRRETASFVPPSKVNEPVRDEAEKPGVTRVAAPTDGPERPKRSPRLIGAIVGGVVVIGLCLWGGLNFLSNMLTANPEATSTSQTTAANPTQAEQTNALPPEQTPATEAPAATEAPTEAPTLASTIELDGEVWTSEVVNSHQSDVTTVSSDKLTDFSLEADVTINTSSSEFHGLMFRVQDNGEEFYNFRITPDGLFIFESWSEFQDVSILGPQESEFIITGQGKTNRLKVIARGPNFEMYINGNKVGTATDEAYAAGEIGLMSCTCNGSSESSATFSNVRAVIFP